VRLYLSSFDLGDHAEALVALTRGGRRAAVVVNPLDDRPRARADWLTDQIEKLSRLGYAAEELDLRDYFGEAEALAARLATLDLVWVSGGNVFILRRAMRQSGFDRLAKEALARDAFVYGGFSAGAVVVAESLAGLEAADDPHSAPAGYAREILWEGLGLLGHALVVHFDADHWQPGAVAAQIAFLEAKGLPYEALRDGEVLLIDGATRRRL
jgi:dipeptidase E